MEQRHLDQAVQTCPVEDVLQAVLCQPLQEQEAEERRLLGQSAAGQQQQPGLAGQGARSPEGGRGQSF